MASPDNSELQQMRQDAIRRSQEMYRRAQTPPGYSGNTFAHGSQPKPNAPEPPEPKEKSKPEPPSPAPEKSVQPKPRDFFKTLFADKERNLVLCILLLLMEEPETDPSLLFALLYLLL